jgi:hypothetical protein
MTKEIAMVRCTLIALTFAGSILLSACSPAEATPGVMIDGGAGAVIPTETTPGVVIDSGAGAVIPTETTTPTSTSTPTPTPLPNDESLPTPQPAPSETPTATLVPTVIPPVAPGLPSDVPAGWFAYLAIVDLDPANASRLTACHLHIVNFDGSGDTDLTPNATDCVDAVAISPDGKWVATLNGSGNLKAGFPNSLNVTSIDGTQARSYSPKPLSTGWIRWAKDGTKLAYLYKGDLRWYVLNAESGSPLTNLDTLSAADWLLPNYSPDGQYRATYCPPGDQPPASHVCITELAADTRPLGSFFDDPISWSGDGAWIGYVVQDGVFSSDKSNDGTWLMHPDGSGLVRISQEYARAIWFDAR